MDAEYTEDLHHDSSLPTQAKNQRSKDHPKKCWVKNQLAPLLMSPE